MGMSRCSCFFWCGFHVFLFLVCVSWTIKWECLRSCLCMPGISLRRLATIYKDGNLFRVHTWMVPHIQLENMPNCKASLEGMCNPGRP